MLLLFLIYLLWLFFVCKFGKPTFTTGISVFMICHKNTFATSWTITFASSDSVILDSIEFIYRNFALRCRLFICHYYLRPLLVPDFDSDADACLAFNLAAFSSSINFFLSAFGIFLNSL